MSVAYEQRAVGALTQIGASTAVMQLDQIAQQVAAGRWSYTHFLGRLLAPQIQARRQRQVETSLRFAGLTWTTRLSDFNFSFQPSIDRTLIEELATGRYLHEGRNLVFLGPPGVGKTHLTIALGVLRAEMGHRLLFLSALELAGRMNTAFAQNRLPHYLKMLTTPRLLIIDEVGYLGLDAQQASMLFQVICSRYEKQGATIINFIKAFPLWGHVFAGDAVTASATLDRLLHRATIINKGDSYGHKEKRQAGLVARRRPRTHERTPYPEDLIPRPLLRRGGSILSRQKWVINPPPLTSSASRHPATCPDPGDERRALHRYVVRHFGGFAQRLLRATAALFDSAAAGQPSLDPKDPRRPRAVPGHLRQSSYRPSSGLRGRTPPHRPVDACRWPARPPPPSLPGAQHRQPPRRTDRTQPARAHAAAHRSRPGVGARHHLHAHR